MSAESTNAFRADIVARIEYFRSEHELTYAEAIGVLHIIAFDLLMEMHTKEHEEDDGAEDSQA